MKARCWVGGWTVFLCGLGCPDLADSKGLSQGNRLDAGSALGPVSALDAGGPPGGGSADGGLPFSEHDGGQAQDCDRDGDEHLALICGGDDCDDENALVHPDALERCSFVDEDCDQHHNEFLNCTFMAAGPETLYRIDPFAGTAETLTDVVRPGLGGMLDIDIDPQGQLLAVTSDGLYVVEEAGTMTELTQVDTPFRTNGMAIDSEGTIFISNDDGDDSAAYVVDRQSGELNLLGNLTPFVSSGDCVALKDDSILMTAPDPDDPEGLDPDGGDILVHVNSATAVTSVRGQTGFHRIFGLSASFGYLFGLTDGGEVLIIDPDFGEATLLFEAENIRFWGAANGD